MALTLYRRHRRDCKAKHPEELHTCEFEERKKGWKHCACPIFASGTLSGRAGRRSTGRWEWDDAKAIAEAWEQASAWVGAASPQPPPPEPSGPQRIGIEKAVKSFLDELAETAAFATHKKYRLLLTKFIEFSTQRGYAMIDQWEPTDVRDFRTSWAINPRTGARRMSMLKPFFEFCVANEWITRNPARAVKNPKGRDMEKAEQRLPFTDDELKRMYEACPKYGNSPRHKWTGEDVADFISLSIYTGLRISDVALFHTDRMNASGEIRLRTTKAGTHVYTWVPQWLQDRIRARSKVHGAFIFGEHETKDLDVITEGWRRKLQKVWALCSPWKVEPTPHRFRHTFARILLQKPGVTVRDVAELLGNTEEMIRKHYGAWVPERQERLTRIQREAFDDKPKPKLVAMPGGRD
jgi:integrase